MRCRRAPLPVCLLLSLLSASDPALGQLQASVADDSTRIEFAGKRQQAIRPGATLTLSIRMTNRRSAPAKLTVSPQLPTGWTSALTGGEISTIDPHESAARLLLIRVPHNAPVGKYEVVVTSRDTEGRASSARQTVEVAEQCHLAIEAGAQTRFVESGQSISASGLVRNDGNVDLRVRLRARSAKGYEATVDSSTIVLPAGGAAEFSGRVVTPPGVPGRETRALIFVARTEGACAGLSDDAAVLFDVIPGAGTSLDHSGRLAGSVTVGTMSTGKTATAQVGFELGGYLDEEERRKLQLAVRLPDRRRYSRFGERGLVRASFETPAMSISAGDMRFGYSTLTRVPGIGRGAAAEVRRGPLTAALFAEHNRLGYPVRRRQGVLLGFRTSDWSSFGATYLRQEGLDQGETITIYATASPGEAATVSLEVGDAVSRSRRTGGVALDATGRKNRWIQYSGRFVHAGPDFPGQYASFNLRHGSLTIRPFGGWSIHSSAKVERQDFHGSEISSGWRRDNAYLKLGMGWRTSIGRHETSVRADLGHRTRLTVTDSRFSLIERDARVTLRSGAGPIRASIQSRYGFLSSPLQELGGNFVQIGISAEYQFGGHVAGLSVEHFEGVSLDHPVSGTSDALRVSLMSRLPAGVRLQVDGFLSRDDYWGGGYQLLHARVWRRIGRLDLAARLQYTSVGSVHGESTTDVGLSIRAPFESPNPFRRGARRIAGSVTNVVTGEPVSGVLVRLAGSFALTGAGGRFNLDRPANGAHLFSVDSSTLDVDLVPMVEMPMPVEVGDLGIEEVSVYVAPAASVDGRFLIKEQRGNPAGGVVQVVRPVPLAIIEIDDGVGSYRTVTNAAGRFVFPKIRPGEYSARVVYAELPRRYRVEKELYVFVAGPGEDASLEILAVPGGRKIKIISGGELGAELPGVSRPDPDRKTSGAGEADVCASGIRIPSEQVHRVKRGESLSHLARTFYGDALLWPVLWLANRDRVPDPDFVAEGEKIDVPGRRFDTSREPGGRHIGDGEQDVRLQELAREYLGLHDLWPLLVPKDRPLDEGQRADPGSEIPPISVREILSRDCD